MADILPGTFYSKREIYQCLPNVIKTTPTTSDKLFIKWYMWVSSTADGNKHVSPQSDTSVNSINRVFLWQLYSLMPSFYMYKKSKFSFCVRARRMHIQTLCSKEERYLSVCCMTGGICGPAPHARHSPHAPPSFGPLPPFHILVSL